MNSPAGDWVSDRYARHRLIEWWDQDRVSSSRVLVVGAGALGNEVIKDLTLIGVGAITIIDFDRVEISNLSRSVLFREDDVGRWKSEAAAEAARRLNPNVLTLPLVGDLEFALGIGEIQTHHVILGCLDSVNARWALNRLAMAAGIPWVNGGINPTAGEVSLFRPGDGPCYECAMTDGMWVRFNERYSCTRLLKTLPARTIPTTIVLASVTAALQVQVALSVVQDSRGPGLLSPGQKVYISVQPYSLFVVDLSENSECLAHDVVPTDFELDVRPDEITVNAVFEYLRIHGEQPDYLSLGFDLLAGLECERCGYEQICRPVKLVSTTLAACNSCGSVRSPVLINRITVSDDLAAHTLSQLGYPPRARLVVQAARGTIGLALTKERGENDVKPDGTV